MKKITFLLFMYTLSVFPHGTSLDNLNSTFLLIVDEQKNILNIHNHNDKVTVTRSLNKTMNLDSDSGKDSKYLLLAEERAAIPNGHFLLEFVNSFGDLIHIGSASKVKAYASHYDAFLPEELPGKDNIIPVQLPGNQNIAGLIVYLKIDEETYSQMGSFDLDLKAYKDPNKITNIFGN